MARRRVCRRHIRCPDCGSNRMRRNGFSNGRPAYRCGKRNGSCFTHSAAALPNDTDPMESSGLWHTAAVTFPAIIPPWQAIVPSSRAPGWNKVETRPRRRAMRV